MATIKDALDIIGKLTTTDESLTTMLLPDAIIFSSVIVPVSPSAAKSVQITTERLTEPVSVSISMVSSTVTEFYFFITGIRISFCKCGSTGIASRYIHPSLYNVIPDLLTFASV